MQRFAGKTVICIAVVWIMASAAFAAGEITLVGEVNDNFQLYAGGIIYEIADTPVGNDMVTNYISEKVEVVGTVETKGEMKILTVRSFKVVPE